MKRPRLGRALPLALLLAVSAMMPPAFGFTFQGIAEYIAALATSATLGASDTVLIVQNGIAKKWAPFGSFLSRTADNATLPSARTNIDLTPYSPMSYGAKCNAPAGGGGGGTDDTAALNAMFAAIRSAGVPFIVDSQGKTCLIAGPINATELKGNGQLMPSEIKLRLDCQTNGKPCVDALGSRFVRYDNLYIYGEQSGGPTIGLQIGRSSAANADDQTIVSPNIWGYFTLAGVYNLASEQTTVINPYVYNLSTSSSSYGWVEDACNHFGVTSTFTTTPAVDTCHSMSGNHFIGGWIAGYAPFWLSGTTHTKTTSTYGVSTGNACAAVLYQNGDSNIFRDVDLDLYVEVTPTDFFCLKSATANFTLRGFRAETSLMNATNSIFKEDPGISAISTADMNLRYSEAVPGAVLFNSPSKWTVDGIHAFLPATMTGNGLPPSMYGSICVKDYSDSTKSKCTEYGTPAFNGGLTVAPTATAATDNSLLGNTVAHTYYAQAYGSCTWDGGATHDVGACINTAITAANSAGGGIVIVPSGTYYHSATIALAAKVWLQGAGGANGGQCGTQLKWFGSASGVLAQLGDDASASTPAGGGLLSLCLSGETSAGVGLKLRSAEYGMFKDIYISKVTTSGIDANPSTTANTNVAFNNFERIYVDLSDASAINAIGLNIGSGTTDGHDFTQNHFKMFTVNFQNGNGIECGAADYNFFNQSGVEPVGGGTGTSLHMLGHASSSLRACRDNFFQGGFGQGGGNGPVAETATNPSVNNDLWLDLGSGGPIPVINGAATLRYVTNGGIYFDNRSGSAGTFGVGAAPSNKAFADFDGVANSATVLKAGTSLPVYLMMSQPIVGFNSYWNAAWKFGKGSSSSWAGYQQFNTTTGDYDFFVSSAAGNADATATMASKATIDHTGLLTAQAGVRIPNATAFKSKDNGGVDRNLAMLFSDNKAYWDGGAAGNVFRTNNGSATWQTTDAGASKILVQHGSASGIPVHFGTAQTTAPALTSCGTGSPAITGTDEAGEVTMGTNAIGCIITFNQAYVAAPYCTVAWQATPLASQSYTVSASAITLTQTSTSGNKVNYNCRAQAGG